METGRQARRAWGSASLAAAVGAGVIQATTDGPLAPAWPVTAVCLALGAVALAGAVGSPAARQWMAPVVAALRLGTVLLAVAVWRGEARELLGGLAVWIAWRDADAALSPARPLAPVAAALALALAWGAYRPAMPAARVVLVGLVAGLAAARGAEARRERASPGVGA